MDDEITMTFLDTMEQAMSILTAEEAGSSSTPRHRRHRCYVNRDREATYLRLQHDYFDDDCVYPYHTSAESTVCGKLFF
jgi:hypothetical protein